MRKIRRFRQPHRRSFFNSSQEATLFHTRKAGAHRNRRRRNRHTRPAETEDDSLDLMEEADRGTRCSFVYEEAGYLLGRDQSDGDSLNAY